MPVAHRSSPPQVTRDNIYIIEKEEFSDKDNK